MVELIEPSKAAMDELIDVVGRAQIEAVLRLSAEGVADPPHPGKKSGAIGWHGREEGRVCLKERKLRVQRPRLRKKGQGKEGEVPIPAYEAVQREEVRFLLRSHDLKPWRETNGVRGGTEPGVHRKDGRRSGDA